ncbi:MAG: AIR synthase-related protein [bacterium]
MAHRIAVYKRPEITDALGAKTARRIARDLDLQVARVDTVEVYVVDGELDAQTLARVAEQVFADPVLERAVVDELAPGSFDWLVEVGFRPGVTDNVGRTARESLALVLDCPVAEAPAVYNAREYRFTGELEREQVERIATELLANTLIQRVAVRSAAELEREGIAAEVPRVTGPAVDATLEVVDLSGTDDELMQLSRDNVYALSLEELHTIREHYADPAVTAARAAAGLPAQPTDVELECLAQTWSEHCKHKIFNARIQNHRSDDEVDVVESLFDTYIKGTTDEVRKARGDGDICVSVFKDNAGVVRFTDLHNLVFKVETHNSPSALDPYGGALTGIVGVNRDPFGTGLGAELIFNTNVFCLASPFYEGEIPPRLLHPRRVLEGVREGVEHGGNKSGIPTVNGSLVFDERYLGKPLVYCGTGGIMPVELQGRPSHVKAARPGDVIVMVGGRIGKDGIHGATFSSEELHEGSPATAVQIGDPITQKRMTDVLLVARDQGLYSAITDNGAGGLSSSVGEMARDPGGATLDLAKAPLKYAGLAPWEIFLSEAQERMTVAVPPEQLDAFMALADRYQVEATALGTFDDSGQLKITWEDRELGRLDMEFLHEGLPPMRLRARLEPGPAADGPLPAEPDCGKLLLELLGRLNVCSKEYWVRQYDHEVQGGSVIKPLCGARGDGPSDAAVLRPLLDRPEGVVVSHGICPRYIDIDPYQMAACAVDEAVRNAVAVGADPARLAALDNFCWSDPVQSEHNPDGAHKLGQLVEACRALYDACVFYGIPLISGKDSMKNDYRIGDLRIGIPPTLLISVLGQMRDASRAVTMDAKRPGHLLYVVGTTGHHLGATEYAGHLGWTGASVPVVDLKENEERYRRLHTAISRGLLASCHDCSDGGLGVALAETAFAGDLGLELDLGMVPREELGRSDVVLFAETPGRFVVTVSPRHIADWEALMDDQEMALVGSVTEEPRLKVKGVSRSPVINLDLDTLRSAWKRPLDL